MTVRETELVVLLLTLLELCSDVELSQEFSVWFGICFVYVIKSTTLRLQPACRYTHMINYTNKHMKMVRCLCVSIE